MISQVVVPRVLVGTLYTEEAQFLDCVESVTRQIGVKCEQFVIKGLPKRLAHDRLFSHFMNHANDCDVFVKLDADMIIEKNDVLNEIASYFAANRSVDLLVIPVDDFFTSSRIVGLAAFRNTVLWEKRDNDLFTDDPQVPIERRLTRWDWREGCVSHCNMPSEFQAFHFGLHRGVKVRQCDFSLRSKHAYCLWLGLEQTWLHFERTNNTLLGLAVLGSEYALNGTFTAEHIAYSHPFPRIVFEKVSKLSPSAIRRKVRYLRLTNGFGLESTMRFQYLKTGLWNTLRDHIVPRASTAIRRRLSRLRTWKAGNEH